MERRKAPLQSNCRPSRYKTGTSARAQSGTRVHSEGGRTVLFPARTCPRVSASGRASLTRLSLVMKGSPVRVRASASRSLTPGFALRRARDPGRLRATDFPDDGVQLGCPDHAAANEEQVEEHRGRYPEDPVELRGIRELGLQEVDRKQM